MTDTGRYRELGPLGAGGMGTVVLADDTLLGRQVALKRLHGGVGGAGLVRLRREARIGASLSHANLVAVFDILDTEDGIVVVMEYVEGETLRAALRRGPLGTARTLEIVGAVAAGLDHIHERRLVHRDVKPGNVLIAADGQVKLADLGLAAGGDLTRLTSSGAVLGTAAYMALEQLEGNRATSASDVHALGVMAFEMLSGKRPRPQGNPLAVARAMTAEPPPDLRRVWPQAPPRAAELLANALAPAPEQRPRSAGALAEALREALAVEGGRSAPVAPSPLRPVGAAGETPQSAVPRPRRTAPTSGPVSPGARPASSRPPVLAAAQLPADKVAHPASSPSGEQPRGRRARAAGVVAGAGLLVAVAAVAVIALAVRSGGGGSSATRAANPQRLATPPPSPGRSASAGASGPGAPSGAAGAGPTAGSAAPAGSPVGAVESFYTLAAAQHPSAAWALADPSFRSQLAGYPSFRAQQSTLRSITFPSATLVSQGQSSATVAISTVATHVDHVDHCAGQVRLVRAPGGWLLHGISITC